MPHHSGLPVIHLGYALWQPPFSNLFSQFRMVHCVFQWKCFTNTIQIKRKPIFSLSWCIFLILVLCFGIQNARTVRNEGRNVSWNFLFAACVCSRATKCFNQRSDYGCQTGSAEPCQLLVICFAWFSSYAYELLWYFVLKKQETISISNYFL